VRPLYVAATVPVFIAAGAAALCVAIRLAPPRLAPDLAQPLAVATNWGTYGALLLAILIAALAIATVPYLIALHAIEFSAGATEAAGSACLIVAGIGGVALLAAWLAPVLFSSDVYAYATYGEMARIGIDPYGHALLPGGDAVFRAAIWQWGNPPPACVYGPAFVRIAHGTVAALARFGDRAQLDGLRAIASASLVLCTLLAYAVYPGNRRERLVAAVFVGCNPVALWSAAEGHNDAIALAVVLAGFAVVRAKTPLFGGAVVALSTLIKLPGLLAAAALAFVDARTRLGVIAGLVIAGLLSIPLFRAALAHGSAAGHYAPQASLQALFAFLGGMAWIPAAAIAAAITWTGAHRLRAGSPDGWAYLAIAVWVLIPNPYPWYALWALAAAALAPASRAALVVVLLGLTALLRYAPDAIGPPSPAWGLALAVAAALPLALLLRAPAAKSAILLTL
jgi:hypothetical protein